ncbi:F0F1 ATP synthase subunit B [Jatrophihabitans telluris]|uniref:ATP synthase subunit b n=1 Tax=Jatrophihabitans telluris TaxID=2038343 RepID=A0ABY4R497_9ACTN|nr:F0F1 ATP synthase subunit B [Jatrophihabitans telluris]UQX89865.1 F0F1 ATP synthase subunit B [Jatrophihabitans telluris]
MTPIFLAADAEPNPLGFNVAEFVLVLIVFVLLYLLVRKFVVPAFEKSFAERRDAIEGGIERAEQAQAEAARLLEQYNAQLAEARSEAAQIREGARAEAQRIVEDLRTQAQEESARIVARGEEQLAAQRSQVVRELRGEIGTLAVELSEKIIGQKLSDDATVRSTVDAFLADIEAQQSAGHGAASPGGSA